MVSVMPIGREWSMASVVQSLLFGMKPADPVALGSGVVLLVVAAVVAGHQAGIVDVRLQDLYPGPTFIPPRP